MYKARQSGIIAKAALLGMWLPMMAFAQFQKQATVLANPENEPAPCHPVPTDRQVLWNETEFYAFFHYGMNTFTDKEWGFGNEDESIYAPTAVPDPEQWVRSVKAAGMRGGIAVVKHHDGFCLWPTATTEHSIRHAGNENGKTNIAEKFARASKKHRMKYGFYVSPWDRNSRYYGDGTGDYVTKVFIPQCEELAKYGSDQFEMWFDGANGGDGYYGGANTTRQIDASIYYDIPNLRAKVHTIAPNCVMWGVGGEARWIGNEQGFSGETCWAMGSGETGDMDSWRWCPGESDAKATSAGWFWHEGESMRSAESLFKMYLETVGRNATLILNCPPDRSGALPAQTVSELKELGRLLHDRLGVPVHGLRNATRATDHARSASITATDTRADGRTKTYRAACMTDGDKDTYWAADDSAMTAEICLRWKTPKPIRYLVLQEYIRLGQRIKDFRIEYTEDGTTWQELAAAIETTTVGYKRIIPLSGSTSDSASRVYMAKGLRISILDSRACPTLHTLSVY